MAVHLPKGTRDFCQTNEYQNSGDRHVAARFHEIADAVETPAFERIETLTGKYSDENDKLMYRIHKRGKRRSQASAT